ATIVWGERLSFDFVCRAQDIVQPQRSYVIADLPQRYPATAILLLYCVGIGCAVVVEIRIKDAVRSGHRRRVRNTSLRGADRAGRLVGNLASVRHRYSVVDITCPRGGKPGGSALPRRGEGHVGKNARENVAYARTGDVIRTEVL